jgi:hypothetical protein
MATAYIQSIDITEDGRVIVLGQLSRTNLEATLVEMIPIMPPTDGIWNYELKVIATSLTGATMLVPFSVEAPWIGDSEANGVRIIQPSIIPNEDDKETVQLKGKRVSELTQNQSNTIWLQGAHFDQSRSHLVIDIRYGGGCFPHLFALEWDGSSMKSLPPQYMFNLVDLSDYDPCKAIIHSQLRFDISSVDFQIDRPATINIVTPSYGRSLRVEINNAV